MLVASLKENDNYKEMEEETFITGKVQFHCFKSWRDLINVKLSCEAGRAEKDAAMAFVPRFQGLVKASGYDNPYFIWVEVFMMKRIKCLRGSDSDKIIHIQGLLEIFHDTKAQEICGCKLIQTQGCDD